MGNLINKKIKKSNYIPQKINDKENLINKINPNTSQDTKESLIAIIENFYSQCYMEYSHAGNLGDIIYSLPVILSIFNDENILGNLYLIPNVIAGYSKGFHPNGNVRLTENGAKFLIPLIKSQHYINECTIYKNQKIKIPLDAFRDIQGMNLSAGHIPRWHFYNYTVNFNLANPWLWTNYNKTNKVIIHRSSRYINNRINYSFMHKYDNIFFVGLEEEFVVCRREIPKLKWIQTSNALELAEEINSAQFFVGNQSFPFSLAEALKVPRILEICPNGPNVIPHGDNAWDFYFQEIFELIFDKLYAKFIGQPTNQSTCDKICNCSFWLINGLKVSPNPEVLQPCQTCQKQVCNVCYGHW